MVSNLPNKNKWVRRAVWAIAGSAVLYGLAWSLVPPILKNQVEKIAGEALGREVTIGRVDFKPWTLELELGELAIAKADGIASQLQIKRVYADVSLQSVIRLAPVIDAVAVDGVNLNLTHLGGGKYDIDDIVARLSKPSDKPPSAPLKFAIFNIALTGSSMDFSDRAVGKVHELRNLNVSVPFLSNLDSRRDVKTEPKLAFKLNGSSFNSSAESTPFAPSRKTEARIRLDQFDLKPYLGYIPAAVPVRLLTAVLNADVKVAFEQVTRPTIKLSGVVEAKGVKVADGRAQDLLGFEALTVTLDDVRPLEQVVKISLLELTAPHLDVTRDKAGKINLMLAPGAPIATNNITNYEDRTRATGKIVQNSDAKSEPKSEVWKLDIAKVAVRGGDVSWSDDALAPQARLALRQVNLDASAIALPFRQPLLFSGSGMLAGGPEGTGVSKASGPGIKQSLPQKPRQQPHQKQPQNAPQNAPPSEAKSRGASVTFSGSATGQSATVNAVVDALPLALAGPYLAQFIEPALLGSLSTELNVNWTPADLKLGVKLLTLDNLAVVPATRKSALAIKAAALGKVAKSGAALASIKKIEVADMQLDLTLQAVSVGKLILTNPLMEVVREQDKRWMFEPWIKPKTATSDKAGPMPPASKAATAPKAKPWRVAVADMSLNAGAFKYLDKTTLKPVAFAVSALKVQAKGFALDAKRPFALTVSARITAPQGEPGQLNFRGKLALSPLAAQGSLVATQIPLHAFEPYFGDALNIELLRADVGFKGDVSFASSAGGGTGPVVRVNGDSVLEEFRANSALNKLTGQTGTGDLKISEELLSWKALSLRGVDFAMAPGIATKVSVAETALSDFFARVLINETGRINLQDLVKSSAAPEGAGPGGASVTPSVTPGTAPGTAPDATKSVAITQINTRAIGQNGSEASVAAATLGASTSVSTGLDPVISIGPVSLVNGKVFFSDRFVKPNYSANLSELTGKLSAFSSVPVSAMAQGPGHGAAGVSGTAGVTGSAAGVPGPADAVATPVIAPQMADLELRGRAEGTASLEILGKLNPLAKPLALDIKGKVRDLELAPLSPYSVKYAGYGIERGKLSVDIGYVVLPDGQLSATNNIILNQLTFGDKVDGAPNSLPVKLAVALLADRHGVIDINLPISGSLNDPQFRLWPIIFKVIVNLIVKAITSPFSLLASAFGGGGDELSMVGFAPGSATLGPDARVGLDKVAKALTDRPGLKMTVVGTASLEAEREAYKRERLKALLQAEKRRVAVAGGVAGQAATVGLVTDTEAPALLKEVYKRADMAKPRNLIGIAKDISANEMEALLLANISVTEDAMRELALQRGVAVKDYLAEKQLPPERLFLGAARPVAPDAKWSPRAELNLLTN